MMHRLGMGLWRSSPVAVNGKWICNSAVFEKKLMGDEKKLVKKMDNLPKVWNEKKSIYVDAKE